MGRLSPAAGRAFAGLCNDSNRCCIHDTNHHDAYLLQSRRFEKQGLKHFMQKPSLFTPALIGVGLVSLMLSAQSVAALTIVRDYVGGSPGTNDTGRGNLVEIFNVAADIWEKAILDDHVLTLHFGWAPDGGGTHVLNAQGGTPNRETEGTILFNSDNVVGHHHYFLDPTPRVNEEYLRYEEAAENLGGGTLNVTRLFSGATGDAQSEDMLTTALHEIGHALGMSMGNTSFNAESADFDVDVAAPIPFSGTSVLLQTNLFGVTSHIERRCQMSGFAAGERVLPSTLDIIALAQLSQFKMLNVNFAPRLNMQSSGTNVVLSWEEVVPGFVLQESSELHQTNSWVSIPGPVLGTDGVRRSVLSVGQGDRFFRLNGTNSVLMLSPISQDPTDVNPNSEGIQTFEGATVNYSASESSGASADWWQWDYAANGGSEVFFQGGAVTIPAISYTYGMGTSGSTFVWTLLVRKGGVYSRSQLAVVIVAAPTPP